MMRVWRAGWAAAALCVACAPSVAGPGRDAAAAIPADTAWVGEDAVRGWRVVLEPLPPPEQPELAAVDAEAVLRAALRVPPEENLFLVHVLAAPGEVPLAALRWQDAHELRPLAPREDATPRERLLYEAAARGGGVGPPRTYLVAGFPPHASEDSAEWQGAAPALRLAARHWTSTARAAFLDSNGTTASSDE